jgi:hypothetical protein
MTTAVPSASPHMSRTQYLLLAVAASLVQMAMKIPGYSEGGSFEAPAWLIVLAISLAVGILLFSFLVPGAGAVTGLVLGMVTVASVLVFWAGVTLPLAAASATIGWRARASADRRTLGNLALALSAVSVVALVAIIIGDAVAN